MHLLIGYNLPTPEEVKPQESIRSLGRAYGRQISKMRSLKKWNSEFLFHSLKDIYYIQDLQPGRWPRTLVLVLCVKLGK